MYSTSKSTFWESCPCLTQTSKVVHATGRPLLRVQIFSSGSRSLPGARNSAETWISDTPEALEK